MILDFKARGGGKFRVYVRTEEFVSSHDDEREAAQQCINAHLADPTCAPYYRHEGTERGSSYIVDLIVKSADGSFVIPPPDPVVPPVPDPDPVPTDGAIDLLEKIATLVPDSTYRIGTSRFEYALPLFATRHKDWLAHALIEEIGGKKRLAAIVWKGILVVFKWSQIDLLARERTP